MSGEEFSRVYFLGIGGIGMSAIARYFLAAGKTVAGYDRTSTPLTETLAAEGMDIHYNDDIEDIPPAFRDESGREKTLVVRTPAVPADHRELCYFIEKGFPMMKRSEILGLITAPFPTYAVAGTHGKTTTSSILAHLFRQDGVNCTAFLGGISVNYKSNLLLGQPGREGHRIVVEADEFDRSFLTLHPDAAIITSMDPDHLDIYGTREEMESNYRSFAAQVKPDGFLLIRHGLPAGHTNARSLTYSITESRADYFGKNIHVRDGRFVFDLVTPGYVVEQLSLGLPGRHNVENAVAACGLALETGMDPLNLKGALASYAGVQRRFELIHSDDDSIFIDDYAHHPEELRAAITSVRELYPGKKITGVFQPHLYSRTRDFASGFAQSLSLLDRLYLLDIYPARELPMPGVDARIIFDKVNIPEKYLLSKTGLIEAIAAQRPQVLLTLGAGDIDQLVKPIKQLLEHEDQHQ